MASAVSATTVPSFDLLVADQTNSFQATTISWIYPTNLPTVLTKSRTLLEEVLICIIEKLTFERYKSSGDLVKIYQDATSLLNMRQKREWDQRVNELLGGLHKIVSAVSSMRNMNSDAHGAGSNRITIKKREALLVANSSMMLAEYWLSIFENKEQ